MLQLNMHPKKKMKMHFQFQHANSSQPSFLNFSSSPFVPRHLAMHL